MRKIFKISGIFSLLYYMIIAAYAGIHVTFSKVWLVFGTSLCLLSKLPKRCLSFLKFPMLIGSGMIAVLTGKMAAAALKKPDDRADFMIVLGARVKAEGPSLTLLRRIETAADYLLKHPNLKVIASGGRGTDEPISEAACIRRELIRRGIKSDRIVLEEKSTSTLENLLYSSAIGGKNLNYILVTNSFHIYRALKQARQLGICKVSGLAAPSNKILLLNYYVREIFALIYHFFTKRGVKI